MIRAGSGCFGIGIDDLDFQRRFGQHFGHGPRLQPDLAHANVVGILRSAGRRLDPQHVLALRERPAA